MKHFGFGILGALRLGATEIRTVSGPLEQRLRLCITGLDQDRLEALEGGADGGETALRVLWPRGEAPDAIREGLARATAASGYGRAQLRFYGELQRRAQPSGKGISLRFDHGSRHGFLELVGGEHGEIEWCHYGVLVQRLPFAGPMVGVWGFLDDDDLRLTASLAGFVQDAKFEAARSFLRGEARRLLLKAAGLRAATLRRQAALAPDQEWMVGFGEWTYWTLERCAEVLTQPERDRPDRFKRALWEIPVLSDMRTGAPVSLFDLWVNRERTGSILVSDRPLFRRADYSWDLFWVPDERAIEALSRRFSRSVRREKIA
ncbi:MAG: hypothetical protein CO113_02765 [Elusimicrobia bacterium CG_4_9_14_3_um_filter_62_55]|nr:MAG: hypothetical protein COR54_10845 [Elusimicrobia bacterium CG22_combo_CG10-13_8_21_14_all_63_91]PJA13061.1 MAG: hypothetical protein COX66_15985 [Elusimicrobia bacterium CG_4_10_14_0_2_um_filter_63_34]PJB26618.1 MAG: hypothetical protein CO113_02765 [Elusimicrobia bacterium CG_4_9_14_3_um_filter_62_55]